MEKIFLREDPFTNEKQVGMAKGENAPKTEALRDEKMHSRCSSTHLDGDRFMTLARDTAYAPALRC